MAKFYSNTVSTVRMALEVVETGTNLANNTSSVTWKLLAWGQGMTSSTWYSNSYHAISVVVNGATVFSRAETTQATLSIGTNTSESAPVTIASGSTTITHNNDGAKSISASFSVRYRWDSNLAWSGSGTLALTTIARASSISSVTTTNLTLGNSITVKWTPASANFSYILRFTIGSKYKEIKDIKPNKTTEHPYSYTPTAADFGPALPNSTSGTMTITLYSYNGNTKLGESSRTITATVPNYTPSIGTVDIQPSKYFGNAANKTTLYVKGYSGAWAKVTGASTSYGASITNFTIEAGGMSSSGGYTSGGTRQTSNFTSSGAKTVKVTLKDSRGKTVSTSKNITVQDYWAPSYQIKAFRVASNTSKVADPLGEYVYACMTPNIASVDGVNTGHYSLTISERSEPTVAFTSGSLIEKWFAADSSSQFTVYADVKDAVQTVSKTSRINTGAVLINVHNGGDGLGIGKVASKSKTIETPWSAAFGDGTTVLPYAINGTEGSNGVVAICRIKQTGVYADQMIHIRYLRRGDNKPSEIFLKFKNDNSSTSPIESIRFIGYGAPCIYKDSDTWVLCVTKIGAYDSIQILAYDRGDYEANRLEVTWPGESDGIITLPSSGVTYATVWDVTDFFAVSGLNLGNYALTSALSAYAKKTEWSGNDQSGYIRFPDNNVQICYGYIKFTIGTWSAWGSGFETGRINGVAYKAAFTAVPSVTATVYASNTDVWLATYGCGSTTTTPSFYLQRQTNPGTTSRDYYVYFMAIGRYT